MCVFVRLCVRDPIHTVSTAVWTNPPPVCVCVSNGLPQVLSVEADRKRVTLTRKKTLLESTLPVVASYAAARPGLVAHGFVVSIKSFGCIVRFYNDVKGLVPLRELSSEPLVNPEELFYVGQVRRVHSVFDDLPRSDESFGSRSVIVQPGGRVCQVIA